MITTHAGRTFDYEARLVAANLDYLIADARPQSYAEIETLWNRSRWWTGGPITDQGQEGACVGHGVVQEAMSSPVRVKPFAPAVLSGFGVQAAANDAASQVYRAAQRIDEWEGESYEGTSVRAGMLVGREKGWWDSFYWAKNMDDLRVGLETGPVVIGVTWKSGMYETADNGLVVPSGSVVGGHCLTITGYSPRYRAKNWSFRGEQPMFRWRNSWGREYGLNGNGYITPDHLNEILFEDRNEAAIATNRSYGLAA